MTTDISQTPAPVLTQDKQVIVFQPSVGRKSFRTTATTYGELKPQILALGFDIANSDVTEGFTQLGLTNDATILPTNIEVKGVVSNDLVIVLTPKENPKSGAGEFGKYTRKELFKIIKGLKTSKLVGKKAKVFFGNHTILKDAEIRSLLTKWYEPEAEKVKEVDTDTIVQEDNGEEVSAKTKLLRILEATNSQMQHFVTSFAEAFDAQAEEILQLKEENVKLKEEAEISKLMEMYNKANRG